MASNRSRASERSAALAATAETPSQALNALARRAARIQIASCSAAAMRFTGWAAAAGHLARTLETDSNELIARIADATTGHLRELIAFPRAAADHLDTRVARVSTDN
jgi:hypothetical protein